MACFVCYNTYTGLFVWLAKNMVYYRVVTTIPQSIALTSPVGRVFADGPEDLGSIPGHVIPKTLKMVLNTSLLNTQQYKVRFRVKIQGKE